MTRGLTISKKLYKHTLTIFFSIKISRNDDVRVLPYCNDHQVGSIAQMTEESAINIYKRYRTLCKLKDRRQSVEAVLY